MLEIDETELTEFFGAIAEEQSQDEREFFAAPLFVKQVDDLEIQFSVSAHLRDMRLTLRRADQSEPVLELAVPNIKAVAVEHHDPSPWLRVTSETHGVTRIRVDPTIRIRSFE